MNKKRRYFYGLSPLIIFLTFVSCSSRDGSIPEVDISSPPSLTEGEAITSQVVKLTDEQVNNLKVKTITVSKDLFSYSLTAPGTVFPAPENIHILSAPVNGRITKIFAHEGEEVEAGSPLLEIESLEFAELAANFLESRAEEIYYTQQVERLSQLVEKKISSQSSLDRTTADLTRAQTRVRAAKARLQAIGVSDLQIEQWNTDPGNERAVLTIYAPITGTINQHLIDPGRAVNAHDMLMDIINNEKVLVRGYVPPEDVPLLRPGGKVFITQRSASGTENSNLLEANITSINPALDEENKSIMVNSVVTTRNQWPVIGQSIRLEYEVITPEPVITIPLSSIEFEGTNAIVFVKMGTGEYLKQPIGIERILTKDAIISSGLSEDDLVAVTQIFSLKALGKFEEFAED